MSNGHGDVYRPVYGKRRLWCRSGLYTAGDAINGGSQQVPVTRGLCVTDTLQAHIHLSTVCRVNEFSNHLSYLTSPHLI